MAVNVPFFLVVLTLAHLYRFISPPHLRIWNLALYIPYFVVMFSAPL